MFGFLFSFEYGSMDPRREAFLMDTITDRQQQILDFIKSEVIANGYPPTVREIGEGVGLRSTASVHEQLNKLVCLGLISRALGKVRAIRVLDPG